MHVGYSSWFDGGYQLSPKLDPDSLGLEGRELEIARVIAEETEAHRAFEKGQIPPEAEARRVVPSLGLLGGYSETSDADERRTYLDSLPWDELFTRGLVHSLCAQRTGLGHVAVAGFALDKCRPRNVSAFFWYAQWIARALDSHTKEEAEVLVRSAQEDAARRSGIAGADERWGPMREAKEWTQAQWADQKTAYDGNKSRFARDMLGLVKQRFSRIDNVTDRTIREIWLKGQ